MNPIEIDLPTETRQRLETQARLRGKTVSELSLELIESGLRSCVESKPQTTKEILESMGQLSSLSEELRNMIIPGVTLEEVRAALTAAGGPSLSEIIDEQRGPKA
jgi:hypothetical protein